MTVIANIAFLFGSVLTGVDFYVYSTNDSDKVIRSRFKSNVCDDKRLKLHKKEHNFDFFKYFTRATHMCEKMKSQICYLFPGFHA